MKKHLLITLLLLAMGSLALSAQNKVKVTGTVLDKDGQAVVGAGVVEQGTLNGVATGIDGKYTIQVASGNSVLEFSCIGFETVRETVGTRQIIDVIMKDDTVLDEIVVIGYGTVKKKDLTGAIAAVDGGKLAAVQGVGLSQALQGSMPGVQVTRTSGLPGAGATIRVRGVTTIGDSDPLIIVDGVPVSSINDVDVDAIENVTVLKDAASASIYGARASAGVILITTKRAKEGQLHIDYNGSFSVLTRTRHPEQVSPTRFMELQNEANWNDAGNPEGRDYFTYEKDFIENYMENHKLDPDAYPLTDWDALMIEKWAPQHKHRVGISYGNKVIKSRAMLSYENEEALYYGRNVEQYTARLNNDIKINDFISASFDMTFNHKLSNNNQINPVQAAFKYNPIYCAVWSDGTMGPGNNGTNTYARIHAGGFDNTERDAFYGKASLTITPFKNFTITGVFAPSLRHSAEKDYVQQAYYYREPGVLSATPLSGCTYNTLTESRTDAKTITKQLLINYSADFGKNHHTTYLLGYEDSYNFSESMSGSSDQMELAGYPYLNLANKNYLTVSGNASDNAYRSFFGRITYDFKGRYLLQVNARYDQSSRFAKEYRGGFFPSVSLGWVVTEEPWMKNIVGGALNFAKIRASYGTLGNERIGNYPYQSLIAFGSVPMYTSPTTISSVMTAAQTAYAIYDITWETTKTWDVGIDLSMFNNRLSFTGDIYRKNTYNMLLSRKIPDVLGYSDPEDNIGQMHTNGWEIQIGWQDRKGDFTYAINANLSDYTSIMGDLGGYQSLGGNIIKEGVEYNAWYGYRSNGLYLTDEQLANSAKLYPSVGLGNIEYKDLDGPDGTPGNPVPDGIVNATYDRVVLGSSSPHYQYGGNILLGWKNWDLSMTFQGIGKVLAWKGQAMVYRDGDAYTFPVEYDKHYWSRYKSDEENAKALYPRATLTNSAKNDYEQTSDYWLFNGGYFRMKNITLSYSLPEKFTKAIKMQKIRFYASATDPFSIDRFPQGWDPESYTNLSAYMTRTFTVGAQLTF
ncbi:MAG: TonB-dependent receptor [Bacteroidales bacterium]|nr:TonB-dependent receptor [Bacteroidales bacterium]MBQ1717845.1 TonB-dependent receptor [Bacteroidales bacterium]MBQ5363531.1 TonB-dependent receptor [Bacteroidales bacterium]